MQSKRKRSKDLFKQFAQKAKLFGDIKLFEKIDIEGIAEKTKIDEFSKKLSMREDILIML
jgi:hypothetical protein